MDSVTPRQVADTAESSDLLRSLARAGYVATGSVHGIIGVIVLVVAAGGDGDADPAGAVRAIAAAPAGFVALWAISIALWALAIWHVLDGILARRTPGDAVGVAKKWGRRLAEWGQAVVSLVLGVIAVVVALGGRPDGETTAERASRDVLSIPGGSIVLGTVGLVVGVVGVAHVWIGVRRTFRKKLVLPPNALGMSVAVLGVVGYVAKGAALVIIGVLFVVSAVTIDPGAAASLDGAVNALLALPGGPWLAAIVGFGLIAYGAFCCFQARYARF